MCIFYNRMFSYSLFYCCAVIVVCMFFFFFFKQKTAYEMRISDWSSDVCSSDLYRGFQDPDRGGDEPHPRRPYHRPQRGGDDQPLRSGNPTGPDHRTAPALRAGLSLRGIRYRLYAELRGVRYAGRCGALHAMWKTPVSDLKVRRWVLASSGRSNVFTLGRKSQCRANRSPGPSAKRLAFSAAPRICKMQSTNSSVPDYTLPPLLCTPDSKPWEKTSESGR